MYLPEKGYKRIIVLTFYIALGSVIAYFFFNYLFVGLLPFLIGWVIARALQSPLRFLHKKAHFPRKITAVVLVFLVVSVLCTLIYLIAARLYSEAIGLVASLPMILANLPDIGNTILVFFERLLIDIPYFDLTQTISGLFANIDEAVLSVIQLLSPTLALAIKNTVLAVPYSIIFIIITIVATCYITTDYEAIMDFLKAQLPKKALDFVTEFKNQFFETTFKYFKAYLLIIFITFCELFIGFSLLGNKYSFVLAAIVSLIDVLPVLGTGTVLLPWAVIEIVIGEVPLGIELLVLYAVVTVVRQIIEPRIVGSSIGLHPLLTLLFMYIGMRLMGIVGLFALPVLAIILKNLNDKGVIRIFKNPPPKDTVKNAKLKFIKFKKTDSK